MFKFGVWEWTSNGFYRNYNAVKQFANLEAAEKAADEMTKQSKEIGEGRTFHAGGIPED